MATMVIMPQGGQDLEKGRVVQWLKNEGEPVKKGEIICVVETEKAAFDIEAPVNGFLRKIVVHEGFETPILSTIGIIGEIDEAIELDTIALSTEAEIGATTGLVGRISSVEAGENEDSAPGRIKITPKAKRIAQEKGIPIHLIKGTGPQGRVTEKDVFEHAEKKLANAKPQETGKLSGGRVLLLSKVRKATARHMLQSKQQVPHFYLTISVDMTAAQKLRARLNNTLKLNEDQILSVTDLITRACAIALKEFPLLNSSVLDEDNLILWDDINIGIAVALDEGLVVPVLEKADRLSIHQIAQQSHRLVRLAREGKQSSLTPGRFTISNLGMFNVDNFIAIINAPEAAILAVASIEKRVVPLGENDIGIREMMSMSLSIDHRIVDGVVGARFLNKVRFLLENPDSLL